MNDEEIDALVVKFEAIKSYPSKWFEDEEWNEFDMFITGYELALKENTL